MLFEKDPYCKCPNCGCKSFKDVSIMNVKVMKDEFGDEFLVPYPEVDRFKCTRCGKEFSSEQLKEHYNKQGQ